MVEDTWGAKPDLSRVPDAWFVSPEYEERIAYAQHLEARMWAVVFGGRVMPRAMLRDDALMQRLDRFFAAGPAWACDRYLIGQGEKEEFQRAMVAVKGFWEKEYHAYRYGSPL